MPLFRTLTIVSLAFLLQDSSLAAIEAPATPPAVPPALIALGSDTRTDLLCALEESTSAAGLDFIAESNEFLVLDASVDEIDILDAQTCSLKRAIDLAAFDLRAGGDIAYWAERDQVVISNSTELAFIDYATGDLEARCAIPGAGFLQGIDVIDSTGDIVLVDEGSSGAPVGNVYTALVVADAQCALLRQSSLLLTGKIGRITYPSAVVFIPSTGRALLNDLQTNRLYALDLEGRRSFAIDLQGTGLGRPTGLARLAETNALALVDLDTNAIYRLELPLGAVAVAEDLSGTFRSLGLNALVTLFERGNGRVTGTVTTAQEQRLALAGDFDVTERTLSVLLVAPNGQPITLTGEVAEDWNTIEFPAPLGLLVRQRGEQREPF